MPQRVEQQQQDQNDGDGTVFVISNPRTHLERHNLPPLWRSFRSSKQRNIHFVNCLFYDEIYFQGVLCLHGLPRSHERLRSSGRVTRFSEFFQPESGHFELRSTFPSPSLPW